jgi:probable rRNA maturation factor
MPVTLVSRVRNRGLDLRRLRRAARQLLEAAGRADATLCVTLVGDAAIRRLNRTYRNVDRPTDVLSFALDDPTRRQPRAPRLLGDVVISLPTARRQAAAYRAPLRHEVERLLVHGILHLLGHDHHRRDERLRMQREERRLAAVIGLPWPY